jgi:hypothetical protein
LYCVFVLFFFVLFDLCCQFLWIAHSWLPLRYSLTFICKNINNTNKITSHLKSLNITKDHHIGLWKSRSWFGTGTKYGGVQLINGIQTFL